MKRRKYLSHMVIGQVQQGYWTFSFGLMPISKIWSTLYSGQSIIKVIHRAICHQLPIRNKYPAFHHHFFILLQLKIALYPWSFIGRLVDVELPLPSIRILNLRTSLQAFPISFLLEGQRERKKRSHSCGVNSSSSSTGGGPRRRAFTLLLLLKVDGSKCLAGSNIKITQCKKKSKT